SVLLFHPERAETLSKLLLPYLLLWLDRQSPNVHVLREVVSLDSGLWHLHITLPPMMRYLKILDQWFPIFEQKYQFQLPSLLSQHLGFVRVLQYLHFLLPTHLQDIFLLKLPPFDFWKSFPYIRNKLFF